MHIAHDSRRRFAKVAISVVIVLYGAPYPLGQLVLPAARYVPPFLVSFLVVAAVFYTLLVWRNPWLMKKLFPEQAAPRVQMRVSDRISALIGLAVAVFVCISWARSF